MSDADVWIYIASDTGAVEAYDTQDEALNAGRDDPNPWVELVQIHRAPKITDLGTRRRSWISPPNLIYTGDGGDAA